MEHNQDQEENNNDVKQEGGNKEEDHEKEKPKEIKIYSHEEKLKSCLQILQKFSVTKYKRVVEAISSLIYEDDQLLNDFLQKIDQPSEISKEDKLGEFLICEYNRDGDYHRSNLSNKYYPKPEEGDGDLRYPSDSIRDFENNINKMFKEYTRLYYSGSAVCSCFCWELGKSIEEGLCVAVVIKNQIDYSKGIKGGCWDSSHLIVINFEKTGSEITAKYKLTSTVFFSASLNHKTIGEIEFSGSISHLVSLILLY